jgi:hypothetical protein
MSRRDIIAHDTRGKGRKGKSNANRPPIRTTRWERRIMVHRIRCACSSQPSCSERMNGTVHGTNITASLKRGMPSLLRPVYAGVTEIRDSVTGGIREGSREP